MRVHGKCQGHHVRYQCDILGPVEYGVWEGNSGGGDGELGRTMMMMVMMVMIEWMEGKGKVKKKRKRKSGEVILFFFPLTLWQGRAPLGTHFFFFVVRIPLLNILPPLLSPCRTNRLAEFEPTRGEPVLVEAGLRCLMSAA